MFPPQAMRTGAIPLSLLRCPLTHLVLDSNQFYGDLPSELGRWQHMRFLHIGQNQFTGEIPKSWCQMASLEGICLDENQFGGAEREPKDAEKTLLNLPQLPLTVVSLCDLITVD